MSGSDEGGERTEKPTEKKREQAREKGQLARSRELAQALVTLTGAVALLLFGGPALEGLGAMMTQAFSVGGEREVNPLGVLTAALRAGAGAVLLVLLLPWLVSLIAPSLVGGLNLSAKGIVPDFSKLDPIKGIGRLFSAQAGAELFKALAKMLLIGGLVVAWIWTQHDRLFVLAHVPLEAALAGTGRLLLEVMFIGLVGLALVAAADVPFQIWNHERQLRMTRDEVRREYYESEGRPEVKAKRRERAAQLSRGQMLEAVKAADVVVTNPTHFAVALRYDATRMRAPTVVAKGADEVAAAIRERAAEHRVLRLESPALARALFRTTAVGQEIPAALYVAVAQVLGWAYRLKAGSESALPQPEVPEDLGKPFD